MVWKPACAECLYKMQIRVTKNVQIRVTKNVLMHLQNYNRFGFFYRHNLITWWQNWRWWLLSLRLKICHQKKTNQTSSDTRTYDAVVCAARWRCVTFGRTAVYASPPQAEGTPRAPLQPPRAHPTNHRGLYPTPTGRGDPQSSPTATPSPLIPPNQYSRTDGRAYGRTHPLIEMLDRI